MNILEELYHGCIRPAEQSVSTDPRCSELLRFISRHGEALLATLNLEQAVVFEKYRENILELQSLLQTDAFIRGFRLGGQILTAVLREDPS